MPLAIESRRRSFYTSTDSVCVCVCSSFIRKRGENFCRRRRRRSVAPASSSSSSVGDSVAATAAATDWTPAHFLIHRYILTGWLASHLKTHTRSNRPIHTPFHRLFKLSSFFSPLKKYFRNFSSSLDWRLKYFFDNSIDGGLPTYAGNPRNYRYFVFSSTEVWMKTNP